MRVKFAAAVAVWVVALGAAATSQNQPPKVRLKPDPAYSPASATQTVKQYCAGCHSDRGKAGDLSLADFDVARATDHPETCREDHPQAARRHDAAGRRTTPGRGDALRMLRRALETRMDRWAAANPNPGWRPFQRLTRAEYAHAVKDLLDVDVDVTAFLPPDTMSQGFDNIADTQSFSPALPQGYLRAASQISRLAVGDRAAAPTTATHRVLATENQMRYVEGTPFGSRGGTAFVHTFPADGLYRFHATLVRTVSGELFGNTAVYMAGKKELLEISVNGERVAVLEVDQGMNDAGEKGLTLETPPIAIKAGPQRIAAAFVPRSVGPVDDLLAPIDQTLIDTRIGTGYGVTMAPHLQELAIAGPTERDRRLRDAEPPQDLHLPSGVAEPGARAAPTDILRRLATQAYRGPVRDDLNDLLSSTTQARDGRRRLRGRDPLRRPGHPGEPALHVPDRADAADGERRYIASPMSISRRGCRSSCGARCRTGAVEGGRRRDAQQSAPCSTGRSRGCSPTRARARSPTRFASQWLRLQDVDKVRPDGLLFPELGRVAVRVVRPRNRALLRQHRSRKPQRARSDHRGLHVRERAPCAALRHSERHAVREFRRVPLPEPRRGLLTQGSVLLLTSVADRTSPVQRGKWVLQVLLGSPPPPPPPDVPLFEATKGSADGRFLSVRERMEQHRSNPACMSCHRVIDPIGLALENFDVSGAYRIKDNGVPVDSHGQLYDGTADGRPGRPAERAAQAQRRVPDDVCREPDDLRARPPRRGVRHAGAARDRPRRRDAELSAFSALVAGVTRSAAFQMSRPGRRWKPPWACHAVARQNPTERRREQAK